MSAAAAGAEPSAFNTQHVPRYLVTTRGSAPGRAVAKLLEHPTKAPRQHVFDVLVNNTEQCIGVQSYPVKPSPIAASKLSRCFTFRHLLATAEWRARRWRSCAVCGCLSPPEGPFRGSSHGWERAAGGGSSRRHGVAPAPPCPGARGAAAHMVIISAPLAERKFWSSKRRRTLLLTASARRYGWFRRSAERGSAVGHRAGPAPGARAHAHTRTHRV